MLQDCFNKHRTLNDVETKEAWHRFLHDQFIFTFEGAANIDAGAIIANAGYEFHKGIGLAQLKTGRHLAT